MKQHGQARTQDFSQGGGKISREARKKKICPPPPLSVFCPPWNCFVQKVN